MSCCFCTWPFDCWSSTLKYKTDFDWISVGACNGYSAVVKHVNKIAELNWIIRSQGHRVIRVIFNSVWLYVLNPNCYLHFYKKLGGILQTTVLTITLLRMVGLAFEAGALCVSISDALLMYLGITHRKIAIKSFYFLRLLQFNSFQMLGLHLYTF